MEFLKHQKNNFILDKKKTESNIQHSAKLFNNKIFQTERDEITRQRLLFTNIIGDYCDVLFNCINNKRASLWEENRLFMIENGAMTLVKDWKYTYDFCWYNIRRVFSF